MLFLDLFTENLAACASSLTPIPTWQRIGQSHSGTSPDNIHQVIGAEFFQNPQSAMVVEVCLDIIDG